MLYVCLSISLCDIYFDIFTVGKYTRKEETEQNFVNGCVHVYHGRPNLG